jgi:hypothetical protein
MDRMRRATRTAAIAVGIARRLAGAVVTVTLVQIGFPPDTPLGCYRNYVREAWRVPSVRATRRLLARTRRALDVLDHES